MIAIRNLQKRYGQNLALDDLSFTVEKGEICGLLGPNGAGKSTTMNIMTGYIGATSGQVLVDGHSIADEPDEAKRRIGYLPELPPLYTEMTVSEYLEFAAELKKVPKDQREEQLDKIMDMTQVKEVSGRLIKNLSKGYRQRVGLAQALVGFPQIIILDEPTVGLDPKQILEIRSLIRDLAKEHTVILSSHILSEVQAVCDHIFIIHHGKLVADGAPAELEEKLTGAPTLEVTVKGGEEEVSSVLAALPGIASVTAAPCEEENAVSYQLKCADKRDVRVELFRACAEHDLPILELHRDSMTLERIFLELTGEEKMEQQEDEQKKQRRRFLSSRKAEKKPETEEPAPASDAAPEIVDETTDETTNGEEKN